jgi:hypothetical protein
MIFFQHPKQVCMTYFQHARLSMNFSYMFLKASKEAFIHAIYPDKYITSTSDTVKEITKILEHSGCRDGKK